MLQSSSYSICIPFLDVTSGPLGHCKFQNFFSCPFFFIFWSFYLQDNLSFPLICPDWNADEEILLLEVFLYLDNLHFLILIIRGLWISFLASFFPKGTEMYGLGNWTEVAEHVGTKSKLQCIDHYNDVYMTSPCFPLPVWHCHFDWSLVVKAYFMCKMHRTKFSLDKFYILNSCRTCLTSWERIERNSSPWPEHMEK